MNFYYLSTQLFLFALVEKIRTKGVFEYLFQTGIKRGPIVLRIMFSLKNIGLVEQFLLTFLLTFLKLHQNSYRDWNLSFYTLT